VNETNPFGRFTRVEKIEGGGVDLVDGDDETVANDTNPCGKSFGGSNVEGGLLGIVPQLLSHSLAEPAIRKSVQTPFPSQILLSPSLSVFPTTHHLSQQPLPTLYQQP